MCCDVGLGVLQTRNPDSLTALEPGLAQPRSYASGGVLQLLPREARIEPDQRLAGWIGRSGQREQIVEHHWEVAQRRLHLPAAVASRV